jgi:hypothetical protein
MVGPVKAVEGDVSPACGNVGKLCPASVQVSMSHDYICWGDDGFRSIRTIVTWNI